MKNTFISLDIIFVREDGSIDSIQKYAEPFSTKSLPSKEPAKYVVEVNAGFCDQHNINEEGIVIFTLDQMPS